MQGDELKDTTLPALGFVAELEEQDRVLLGSHGEFFTASRGDYVITEGSTQDSLFLVISGILHVRTRGSGHPVLLGRLRTGDSIGEINIFNASTASATVTAAEPSDLWRINREMLDQFCETNRVAAANLLIRICVQLSRRLRVTNEKLSIARDSVSEFAP